MKVSQQHVAKSTPCLTDERIAQLKGLFPETVAEARIDFDKLRTLLGDDVDDRPERYTFSWAGKRDAIRMLQTPSAATLVPCEEESIDFEDTQNVFIEGENLEVLKLLYKTYAGRVKMIYIDPPYNTGNDFIYPDNYADPLDTYLRLTGQKDAQGNLLTSNPETSGRYHSAWLSMMYPRLVLARQLLREDGVIFISIDDHEVHNLRMLMNEVFGEENFVAILVWENKEGGGGSDSKHFRIKHEYVLCFAKEIGLLTVLGVPITNVERYTSTDEHVNERGPYYLQKLNQASIQYSTSLDYPIEAPDGTRLYPKQGPKSACWRWSRQKVAWGMKNGFIEFKRDRSDKWQVYTKQYMHCDNNGNPIMRTNRPMGVIERFSSTSATKQLEELFRASVFPYPKPAPLVAYLLSLVSKPRTGDIVLDFFAGSCTTAHATLQASREDAGNRRFIMVQLPEPTGRDDYPTIADIGKERIRRVIARMEEEDASQLDLSTREAPEDLGFRVFKLAPSNYRPWRGTEQATPEAYADQMELFTDPLVEGWNRRDVIWEVAIKEGYGLDSRIERVGEVESQTVFQVTDPDREQFFVICLDDGIRLAELRSLRLDGDTLFVCRDVALNDETAANLALQCRLKTI